MALANPCPESPIPWRERRGREGKREERERKREKKREKERGRERERKKERGGRER